MDIKKVEEKVFTFLQEHRGTFFNALELSTKVMQRFPNDTLTFVDVKIASLNLVGSGRARINNAWTVGIPEDT